MNRSIGKRSQFIWSCGGHTGWSKVIASYPSNPVRKVVTLVARTPKCVQHELLHQNKQCSIYSLHKCEFSFSGVLHKFRHNTSKQFLGVPDLKKVMAESKEKWMDFGKLSIYPWSIAGIESCIVVRANRGHALDIVFDMGHPVRESYKCDHVFISHGHVDHIAGLLQHAAHRKLFSMKKATYYMPPHLLPPVRDMAMAMRKIHETDMEFTDLSLVAVQPHDTVQLGGGYFVKSFPTVHRVASQGYILYHKEKTLKEEYKGLPHTEIAQLLKDQVAVHQTTVSTELAYTGDTTFEIFLDPPNDDLFKVKVLISEATYIDSDKEQNNAKKSNLEKARERGHIHLSEFEQNEHLFQDVQNILLVHLSNKYSPEYIHKIHEALPEPLRSKVRFSTLMKEVTG